MLDTMQLLCLILSEQQGTHNGSELFSNTAKHTHIKQSLAVRVVAALLCHFMCRAALHLLILPLQSESATLHINEMGGGLHSHPVEAG